MKIVDTDMFGGDYPNESFVLFTVSREGAEVIVAILNKELGPHARRHYKVVEDDYVLVPGFEP